MNFLIFFCLLWSIGIAFGAAKIDLNDEVILLHYDCLDKWPIQTTMGMLRQIVSHQNLPFPRPSEFEKYCPNGANNMETSTIPNSLENLQKRSDVMYELHPDLMAGRELLNAVGFRISTIHDPAKPSSDKNELKLPVIDYTVTRTDRFRRYDVETLHYIGFYNRCLVPTKRCENYNIPEKNPEEARFVKAYEEENQDAMFKEYKIADEQRSLQGKKQYFVAHKMAPIDDFIEEDFRVATCLTYNTTTPIWRSISEGALSMVEDFIQQVAEKLFPSKFQVITLTRNLLTLKTNSNEDKKIWLTNATKENRVPVNKYFVKILTVRPSSRDGENKIAAEDHSQSHFQIVIVIHNELTPHNKSDRLCNKNAEKICHQNGWKITNDGNEDGGIYCCTRDDASWASNSSIKRLLDATPQSSVLNLNTILTAQSVKGLQQGINKAEQDKAKAEHPENPSFKYCFEADPLAILYFDSYKTYAISAMYIAQLIIKEKDSSLPKPKFIILLCARKHTGEVTSLLEDGQIFNDTELSNAEYKICKFKYQPSDLGEIDGYKNSIGYYISINGIPTIPEGSPPFASDKAVELDSAKLDNSGETIKISAKAMPVIWYDKEALHKARTMHHFHFYKLSLIPNWTCKDYTSPQRNELDAINEKMYAEAYDEVNQDKMFRQNRIDDSQRSLDREKQYFVAHKMVPVDDFVEDSLRMAACWTYYTTTPIWSPISENDLKIVERFIQRLADKLPVGTLKVRTEVKGNLQLKAEDGTWKDIKLNDKNVGKYFLKIVGYRETSTAKWIYMVIVIENELTDHNQNDRLCNKNKEKICGENGWIITEDRNKNGGVYCCKADDSDLEGQITFDDEQDDKSMILNFNVQDDKRTTPKSTTRSLKKATGTFGKKPFFFSFKKNK